MRLNSRTQEFFLVGHSVSLQGQRETEGKEEMEWGLILY